MPAGTPGYGSSPTMVTRKPRVRSRSTARAAGDADQIGHDVVAALLATIDEERDLGAARRARRFLCDDGAAGKVRRADFGERDERQTVLLQPQLGGAFGFAGQRRNDGDSRTLAQPHANAALTARDGARAQDPAARCGRRESSDRAGRSRRRSAPAPLPAAVAVASATV